MGKNEREEISRALERGKAINEIVKEVKRETFNCFG